MFQATRDESKEHRSVLWLWLSVACAVSLEFSLFVNFIIKFIRIFGNYYSVLLLQFIFRNIGPSTVYDLSPMAIKCMSERVPNLTVLSALSKKI